MTVERALFARASRRFARNEDNCHTTTLLTLFGPPWIWLSIIRLIVKIILKLLTGKNQAVLRNDLNKKMSTVGFCSCIHKKNHHLLI